MLYIENLTSNFSQNTKIYKNLVTVILSTHLLSLDREIEMSRVFATLLRKGYVGYVPRELCLLGQGVNGT